MPSKLSELFPSSGHLPGGLSKDPTFLPLFDATPGLNLYIAGTAGNPNLVTFWDTIASTGAIRTTATANTYGQIANITGRGLLFHVFPPTAANLTDNISYRITVDGTVHEISRTGSWRSVSVGGRAVLGAMEKSPAIYTTEEAAFRSYENATSLRDRFSLSGTGYLVPPHRIMSNGFPAVYFEESLKIETKVQNVSAGGTYAAYSGASYTLIG